MSLPLPGWFTDPNDPALLRWWDGAQWSRMTMPTVQVSGAAEMVGAPSTGFVRAADQATSAAVAVTPAPVIAPARWRPTPLFWLIGGVFALILLIALASGGFGSFFTIAGLIGLPTGIYAAARKRGSWANLPLANGARAVTIGASAMALILGTIVTGATHPTPAPQTVEIADQSAEGAAAASDSPSPEYTPEPTRTATPTATPSPTPEVVLSSYVGVPVASAKSELEALGLVVNFQTSDGSAYPTDWTGWSIVDESPNAGSSISAGRVVHLYMSPPAPVVVAPVVAPPAAPAAPAPAAPVAPGGGATALCNDGSLSYAAHHQGACSHHGGVATFYK